MRLPRVRIGIRGMMVAVLIAGGLLGWRQHQIYERLRDNYEEMAGGLAILEEQALQGASVTHEEWLARCREVDRQNREGPFELFGRGGRVIVSWPESSEVQRQQADHYGRMKAKYERAALRPWLPVEPDEYGDGSWLPQVSPRRR
jgi:hypothetical protein